MAIEMLAQEVQQLPYRGHNLVFIVGSSRSGTTWLQRLLASHPNVHTGQESYVFEYLAPSLRTWKGQFATNRSGSRGGVGLPCYFYEDEFMKVLHQHMMNLMAPMLNDVRNGGIFIEKSPAHSRFIPEIMELLPDCRIVHMLRDARDVSASMLAAHETWGAKWAPRYAFRAARKWTKDVRAVRQTTQTLPEDQFLEVRYEDLSNSPDDTIRRLSSFLGLEWTDAEIHQAIADNAAEKMRSGGGTQIPLRGEFGRASAVVEEPKDFVRKARPNTWKEDLSLFDKVQVWIVARQLMAEVGYPWRAPW